MRLCRASLLVTALVVMVGDPVAAQSARDIVDEMLAAYEARMTGIENYTLVQGVMGFETVTYHEKEVSADGRAVFRTAWVAWPARRGHQPRESTTCTRSVTIWPTVRSIWVGNP